MIPLFSRVEKPTVPEFGSPCSASATRSLLTSWAGTMMVAPPLANWKGTFAVVNCVVIAPESEGWRLVNSG